MKIIQEASYHLLAVFCHISATKSVNNRVIDIIVTVW